MSFKRCGNSNVETPCGFSSRAKPATNASIISVVVPDKQKKIRELETFIEKRDYTGAIVLINASIHCMNDYI